MALKKSPNIKAEILEVNIDYAKKSVLRRNNIPAEEVLSLLNGILRNSYQYVPEEELETFRLPKGMVMGGCK